MKYYIIAFVLGWLCWDSFEYDSRLDDIEEQLESYTQTSSGVIE